MVAARRDGRRLSVDDLGQTSGDYRDSPRMFGRGRLQIGDDFGQSSDDLNLTYVRRTYARTTNRRRDDPAPTGRLGQEEQFFSGHTAATIRRPSLRLDGSGSWRNNVGPERWCW